VKNKLEVKNKPEAECPACKGNGRLYSADLIGDRGILCGVCLGAGKCSLARREELLDAMPVTRGEVKALISAALEAALEQIERGSDAR